jgi:hypothetical protein
VPGDPLDRGSAAFEFFDPSRDAVWMAEAAQESRRACSSRPRIAMFLASSTSIASSAGLIASCSTPMAGRPQAAGTSMPRIAAASVERAREVSGHLSLSRRTGSPRKQ